MAAVMTTPVAAPERALVKTQRLRVQLLGPNDVDALRGLLLQPGLDRYFGQYQSAIRSECVALLAENERMYQCHGTGIWAVARHLDPESMIGAIALCDRKGRDAISLAFALKGAYRGNGYAAEAVEGVLVNARERLGVSQVQARVDFHNTASACTLWRLGFRDTGYAHGDDGVLRVFRKDL